MNIICQFCNEEMYESRYAKLIYKCDCTFRTCKDLLNNEVIGWELIYKDTLIYSKKIENFTDIIDLIDRRKTFSLNTFLEMPINLKEIIGIHNKILKLKAYI